MNFKIVFATKDTLILLILFFHKLLKYIFIHIQKFIYVWRREFELVNIWRKQKLHIVDIFSINVVVLSMWSQIV